MAPRTSPSRPRRRTSATPAPSPFRPAPIVVGRETRTTIAHHGSSLTMLWVLMLCMCIAVWLVLLVVMFRLDQLEASINGVAQQVVAQQAQTVAPDSLAMLLAKQTATVPVVPLAPPPILVPASSVSPSGVLDRGMISADGARYAGYDSATKGKIGIGVEIVATKQVKHIVIFDTRSEATGKGTPSEGEMSVRWTNANTIEYDLLVKKGSGWVKETQTVKIFF